MKAKVESLTKTWFMNQPSGEVYPNIRNTGAPEKYPMIVICPDDQLAR